MDDRRVTIHSDGHSRNTVVVDSDGNRVENLRSVNIDIRAGEFTEATLELTGTNVKVDAHVRTCDFVCPMCSYSREHECDTNDEDEYPTLGGGSSASASPHVPNLEPSTRIFFMIGGRQVPFVVEEAMQQNGPSPKLTVILQDEESWRLANKGSGA